MRINGMDKRNRKYDLFSYIEQQLRDLGVMYPKDLLLGKIEDDGLNLTFTFITEDGYVDITMPDKLIAKFRDDPEYKKFVDRKAFIQDLKSHITECLAYLKENPGKSLVRTIKGDIDFSVPLCPELDLRLRELALNLVSDSDNYNTYINVEYLNSLGSPLFVYNLLGYLIPLARLKGLRVALELTEALKDPQYHLIPYRITERFNKMLEEEEFE